MYRPPNLSKTLFINELNENLDNIAEGNKILTIIGDININLHEHCTINSIYKDALYSRGFIRGIFFFNTTREEYRKQNLVTSCIDHHQNGRL